MMNDEGIFATIARDLRAGGLPYRDLFDIVPPMTPVWYALAFTLFGEQSWIPQLLLAAALCITCSLVYVAGRLLFSARLGLLAALLFSISTGYHQLGIWAMDEALTLPPITGALVCLILALQSRRSRWLAGAGLLGGVAVLTSQLAALHLMAAGVVLLVFFPGSRRSRLMALTHMTIACALPLVAVAFLYATRGALGDLVYGAIRYPILYGGGPSLEERFERLLVAPAWFAIVATPPVMLGIAGTWRLSRHWGQSSGIVLGWGLASLLAVAAPGHFHRHYFIALLPYLALAGSVAVGWAARLSARQRIVALGALAVAGYVAVLANLPAYLPGSAAQRHASTGFPLQRLREVQAERTGRALAHATHPDETVLNLGRLGQLYFYADRQPASRFFHVFPLKADPSTVPALLADLEHNLPAVVIDSQWPSMLEGDSIGYPLAVSRYLAMHYVYAGRIPFDADILQLHTKLTSDCSVCNRPAYFADVYVRPDRTEIADLLLPRR